MEISFINIVTLFIVYSFLGWLMESIYKSIIFKKVINTGFLYGPFCPIYGIGAIIMLLFLKQFSYNLILLFFAGFIVLSVWEYFVGWLLELVFKTTYWDYSDHKFNIKGRVCLTNSIYWGVLGVVFIKYINPFIENLLNKIPSNIVLILTIIIGLYILIDAIVTITKVKGLEGQIEKISQISNSIKIKLEELKELGQEQVSIEKIQDKIDELKYKQTKLKRKVLRRTNRLKKAFPTMKPNAITEYVAEKIEAIKEKTKGKGDNK